VKRLVRTLFQLILRQLLVLGLAFTPLAQPISLAAAAAMPASKSAAPMMAGCHHHAHQQPDESGGCCWKKGSACHCAMTVALPASPLPDAQFATFARPTSSRTMTVASLSPPEPPPPRD
jgi:hypothetical protein